MVRRNLLDYLVLCCSHYLASAEPEVVFMKLIRQEVQSGVKLISDIRSLIEAARQRAVSAVNAELFPEVSLGDAPPVGEQTQAVGVAPGGPQ